MKQKATVTGVTKEEAARLAMTSLDHVNLTTDDGRSIGFPVHLLEMIGEFPHPTFRGAGGFAIDGKVVTCCLDGSVETRKMTLEWDPADIISNPNGGWCGLTQ